MGAGHLRTGLNALSSLDNWATDRRTVSCLTFRFPFVFLEQMKCDPIFPEISSLKSYQRGNWRRDRRNQALAAPRGGIVLQLSLSAAGSLPTFPGLRAARRSCYRGSWCQTRCCTEGKAPFPVEGGDFLEGGWSWLRSVRLCVGSTAIPPRGAEALGSAKVRAGLTPVSERAGRQGSAQLSLGVSSRKEIGDPLG